MNNNETKFKILNKINDYVLKEGEILLVYKGKRQGASVPFVDTFINYNNPDLEYAFKPNSKRKLVIGTAYVYNQHKDNTFAFQLAIGKLHPTNNYYGEVGKWSVEEVNAEQFVKLDKANQSKHKEHLNEDIKRIKEKAKSYKIDRNLVALYVYTQLLK
jgi:hypothetical protein